ncbi:hypothetical protein VTJ49DRAFT_6501 [Mycothermus thermophilus]|uniref:RRM domain-containing protein n=1 Tax=Humicola insolens TaxID=85995 RepID=A0ABR3V1E0_HUMIN
MNQIRAIQALNKREIENGVPPEASWHADYRDTAFIYFGGLPYELTEGDVITIFSQFGEPVFLKLARDKETGKSKGFGWLKYEDQRSTDLAVDNLGGAQIGGRMIRVDHARYKVRDDEDVEQYMVGWEDMVRRERREKGLPSEDEEDETDEEAQPARPLLKEEKELQLLIQNHDDDDPMKEFLIEEKKKEVEEALRREKRRAEKESRRHRDKDRDRSREREKDRDKEKEERRHRSHRSRRDGSSDEGRGRDRDRRSHGGTRRPQTAATDENGTVGSHRAESGVGRGEAVTEIGIEGGRGKTTAGAATETTRATGEIATENGNATAIVRIDDTGTTRGTVQTAATGIWRSGDATGQEVGAGRRVQTGTKCDRPSSLPVACHS